MNAQGDPPPYTPGPHGPPQHGPNVVHATVVPTAGPRMVPIIVGQQMGSNPSVIRCKSCNLDIVTRVEMRPTMRTHLFAALLCLFVCWPCMCVPYCVGSCNNIEHYCPNCNAYIGTYLN